MLSALSRHIFGKRSISFVSLYNTEHKLKRTELKCISYLSVTMRILPFCLFVFVVPFNFFWNSFDRNSQFRRESVNYRVFKGHVWWKEMWNLACSKDRFLPWLLPRGFVLQHLGGSKEVWLFMFLKPFVCSRRVLDCVLLNEWICLCSFQCKSRISAASMLLARSLTMAYFYFE